MIALAGAALAVFAMFMVSTVSFAAPAFASTPVTSAACADMDMDMGGPSDQAPNKGVLLCAKDCAVICHALLTPPLTTSKLMTFAPVAYLTHHPRLTSVVVDRDDPPPR